MREGRVGWSTAAGMAAGFAAIVVAAILLGGQPASAGREIELRLVVAASALGSAAAIHFASLAMAPVYRRGWRLIGWAMLTVAATHLAMLGSIALQVSPLWSAIAVTGGLAAGVLGLVGLVSLGLRTWTRTRLLNLLMDAIITGLSVLVMSWVAAAAHYSSGADPTASVVIWGSISVVLASLVLLAISQVPRAWLATMLLMAGAGAVAMMASITAPNALASDVIATPTASLLYAVTFGLVGLAPLPGAWGEVLPRSEPWFFQRVIPYFAALGALVAILATYLSGQDLDEAVLILGAAIATCLVLRQVIATFDERVHAEQLLHQATHDSLTGLPNRIVLLSRLSLVLQRQPDHDRRHAVLFIDLDDFKSVNDGISHDIGDVLLISAAERLRKSVRPADLVARLGGDEFAILLESANVEETAVVCRRICDAFRESHRIDKHELRTTCSIGVGWSEPGDAPNALLRKADAAMYAAKRAGKNSWRIFDADMQADATLRLRLLQDFAQAVATDQLCLVYQPVVELRTGKLASAEALLRWYQPGRGWRSIADAIPALEGSSLMTTVDGWVLRRACEQAALWRAAGSDLTVSVNVTARDIGDAAYPGRLLRTLTETGVEPGWISLEVTESAAYAASASTRQVLEEIRALGVSVSIDDFGTGYSALQRLHDHRFDTLKIDRSFVTDFESRKGSVLLRAVIAMADSVGLDVIAEGIETEDQAETLASWGCRYGQGFHFSPPASAAAFERRYLAAAAEKRPALAVVG